MRLVFHSPYCISRGAELLDLQLMRRDDLPRKRPRDTFQEARIVGGIEVDVSSAAGVSRGSKRIARVDEAPPRRTARRRTRVVGRIVEQRFETRKTSLAAPEEAEGVEHLLGGSLHMPDSCGCCAPAEPQSAAAAKVTTIRERQSRTSRTSEPSLVAAVGVMRRREYGPVPNRRQTRRTSRASHGDERLQFSRSAAVTSMRDARRAGRYDANSVTASIVSGTSASTHGSSALIS